LKSAASLDNNSEVIWYNANSLFGIIIDNTKEKNFGKMKIFPKLMIVVKPKALLNLNIYERQRLIAVFKNMLIQDEYSAFYPK
jgi:predicted ATP-grasp superfamily ATP-dependent carboligase